MDIITGEQDSWYHQLRQCDQVLNSKAVPDHYTTTATLFKFGYNVLYMEIWQPTSYKTNPYHLSHSCLFNHLYLDRKKNREKRKTCSKCPRARNRTGDNCVEDCSLCIWCAFSTTQPWCPKCSMIIDTAYFNTVSLS
ncbi:hypothetical protein ILYODFUR_006267 [Ilyodon furcidens]|uniref:RING-type domain-containing protein n=1 Tax=Ilyodon furcidens TaxID=33524 RepID=A0ABV0TW80_9TELE